MPELPVQIEHVTPTEPKASAAYEAPVVAELGTLTELTSGAGTASLPDTPTASGIL